MFVQLNESQAGALLYMGAQSLKKSLPELKVMIGEAYDPDSVVGGRMGRSMITKLIDVAREEVQVLNHLKEAFQGRANHLKIPSVEDFHVQVAEWIEEAKS